MVSIQPEENEHFLSLGDCLKMFKRRVKTILGGMFFCAILLGFYGITRPVEYQVEATFKEKGNSCGNIGGSTSSLTSYLLNGFSVGNKSEAKTMMESRKLLEQVVTDLGLQCTLTKKTKDSTWLKKIGDNLIVEYYYLKKYRDYPLPDEHLSVCTDAVAYNKEIPTFLTLVFEEENSYSILDSDKKIIGKGVVGQPFKGVDFQFTLSRTTPAFLKGDIYLLSLEPVSTMAMQLAEKITIVSGKDDDSLLKLSFSHRNRHYATRFVNQLMQTYQVYLREEQSRISKEQIAYLNRRENEMDESLKKILDAYANRLSSEITEIGYAHSSKALEFLTREMQNYHQKEMGIQLELKRQNYLKSHNIPLDSRYQSDANPLVLNELISQIRGLNQLTDSIELALRNSSSKDLKEWQKSFTEQISELSDIRHCSEDAKVILASLENEMYPLPSVTLFDHPKYLVRSWNDQLLVCQDSFLTAHPWEKDSKKEEFDQFRSQFVSYLTNLLHFLEVNAKVIEERLAHQQAPQFEFQGVDLATSKELYINYSKQLSEVEGKILQVEFIIVQLQDPNFEISSLSTIIDDPVTKEIVKKASEYVLAVQDDANRGQKEKERLKKELDVQKRFLSLHLGQTVQLLGLREGLIKNKIQSLQNASLELIQQQVSILENQFRDTSDTHVSSLKREQQLIHQYSQELKKEMALLPRKWTDEHLVEHQIKMNSKMVEELTKLVESKNITYNLEIIQSAPLDKAFPPVNPQRPRILFYTILGAILGAALSLGSLLLGMIVNGVPVSVENLELSGFHVSGMAANHLNTWRRVIAFFSSKKKRVECLTLAGIGSGAVTSTEKVASILSKRGEKVLLIDLDSTDEKPASLLQYLEGTVDKPTIIADTEGFDRIEFGDQTQYALELCQSAPMQALLTSLQKQYDWILAASSEAPGSPFAVMMVDQFDQAVFFLKDENLLEIQQLASGISKSSVTFVIC